MASYSGGAKAFCPFYLKESKKSITCEGLIDGVDSLMRFRDETAKKNYQENHCNSERYYLRCRHAKALHEKYEEQTDEKIDLSRAGREAGG